LGKFKISLPGRHNVLNSLAVIAGSLEMGLNIEKVRQNLLKFYGAARRFDILGEYRGAVVIDDYAHHPAEVKASLQAVAQRYPGRNITVVFHPHTFSRTRALLDDFAKSFLLADDLHIVEIYSSAREAQDDKISSLDLIKKIEQYNQTKNKKQKLGYFADLEEVEKNLPKKIKAGDVVLLLGAGDIFRVAYNWLKIK
jgi:UDP-N-acetylmuramate--alanine ligase